MDTLLTSLLARLTSATGVTFATNPAGDIVVAADDAFKLAAVVDLASRAADVMDCFGNLRKTIALGSEVFPASVPSMERKPAIDADYAQNVHRALDMFAAEAEQEKLAEAGRKSWVTRRANAAKKGGAQVKIG